MVEPIQSGVGAVSAGALVRPTGPREAETTDPIRGQIDQRLQEIQRQQQAERARSASAEPSLATRDLSFNPRPDLNLVQTSVIDREEGTIIREVPTSARLKFATEFRRQAADLIGKRIDRFA